MKQEWPYGLDGDTALADRLEELIEHLDNGISVASGLGTWNRRALAPDRSDGRPEPITMPPFDEFRYLGALQGVFWATYGPAKRERVYRKNRKLRTAWQEHHAYWTNQIDQRQREIDLFDLDATARTIAAKQFNEAIQALEISAAAGDTDAQWSLAKVTLDKHFARTLPRADHRESISHDSKRVVVEVEVPRASVVPREKTARRLKTTGDLRYTYRSEADIRRIYTDFIAQVALATANASFVLSDEDLIETAVVNLFVVAPDPATGRIGETTILSVMASRQELEKVDLEAVDPVSCIRHLSATVSRSPTEVVPVRPLATVEKSDARFVTESDVLASLDTRPNLMELSPTEFEGLVQNLFASMGLDTKQTRASRDGGVDAIAFDPRPIIGGKIVIQAKRYKNVVGVSAVRDLFGTLQNEGGSKGILVTTSGYGKASFEFAKNKPLELIDGSGLLYLLKEHAGIEARIVVPDNWRDPVPD